MLMANGRHMPAMLGLFLILVSIVVTRASAGLESVAVVPNDSTCCSPDVGAEGLQDAAALSPHLTLILEFIHENGSSNTKFHVQGWRWHTLSLARDARRLGALAANLSRNATINDKSLEKAVYHVIEFNMKALHRIENKTFFPWLKTQLSAVEDANVAEAFALVMKDVIYKQGLVSEAGSQVMKQVDIIYSSSSLEAERVEAVKRIAELSEELSSCIQTILKIEDTFLVPAITILVSESKQRAFNKKVILNLGVLDSRIHLVGMHEAVLEQGDDELELFQQEIPSIPRYMIPRWKRLLYDPQAFVLEEESPR